jgi:hypothetical protein
MHLARSQMVSRYRSRMPRHALWLGLRQLCFVSSPRAPERPAGKVKRLSPELTDTGGIPAVFSGLTARFDEILTRRTATLPAPPFIHRFFFVP